MLSHRTEPLAVELLDEVFHREDQFGLEHEFRRPGRQGCQARISSTLAAILLLSLYCRGNDFAHVDGLDGDVVSFQDFSEKRTALKVTVRAEHSDPGLIPG